MLSSQLFPGQTWSNYHRLHSCCGGLWEHVSTSFPLVQLAVCRVEVCAAQPLPTALETVGDWCFGWPIAVIPLLENKNLRLRLLRTRENRNNARAVTYSLKYIEIYNYYIYIERERYHQIIHQSQSFDTTEPIRIHGCHAGQGRCDLPGILKTLGSRSVSDFSGWQCSSRGGRKSSFL